MSIDIEDLGSVVFEELAFENLFITPSCSEILPHILTLEAEMNYQIYAMSNNGGGTIMKVKELIELLGAFNGELEVLVDCRELDNVVIYEDVNYYQEDTVVMVNT